VQNLRNLLAARSEFATEVKLIPAHRPDLHKLAELTTERLWPSTFPATSSWPALRRLPVWWKTAARRLRSARENPPRESQRASQLAPFAKALSAAAGSQLLSPRLPGALLDADPREHLQELAWLLEEMRVQIWAQELGVTQPASEKRVREMFALYGVNVS
jgi:ATP-dependent helicase HrpA